jgi:phage-related protein
MEIAIDVGDAYRVLYVTKFADRVYVLHCFMKKSRKGIATPKNELKTASARYKEAKEDSLRSREAPTGGGRQHGQ